MTLKVLPVQPSALPWMAFDNILAGRGNYLPVPADNTDVSAQLVQIMQAGYPIDSEIKVVIATSGSTGYPKGAQLTRDALVASIAATHARIGPPGQWLLALPPHHIAGLQVILRSLWAGYCPEVLDVRAGFSIDQFMAAAERMTKAFRYISLVPNQLAKILDSKEATETLANFDGVIIGGAATADLIKNKAVTLKVHYSYGMSETCGGCVYNGKELDGVKITLTDASIVKIAGPVIAQGYRNIPKHPAFTHKGVFETSDIGRLENGKLIIVGRADDVINSGGIKIHPSSLEQVAIQVGEIKECIFFDQPDPILGKRVACALVVNGNPEAAIEKLINMIVATYGAYAKPRAIYLVDQLPILGSGKYDRQTIKKQSYSLVSYL